MLQTKIKHITAVLWLFSLLDTGHSLPFFVSLLLLSQYISHFLCVSCDSACSCVVRCSSTIHGMIERTNAFLADPCDTANTTIPWNQYCERWANFKIQWAMFPAVQIFSRQAQSFKCTRYKLKKRTGRAKPALWQQSNCCASRYCFFGVDFFVSQIKHGVF